MIIKPVDLLKSGKAAFTSLSIAAAIWFASLPGALSDLNQRHITADLTAWLTLKNSILDRIEADVESQFIQPSFIESAERISNLVVSIEDVNGGFKYREEPLHLSSPWPTPESRAGTLEKWNDISGIYEIKASGTFIPFNNYMVIDKRFLEDEADIQLEDIENRSKSGVATKTITIVQRGEYTSFEDLLPGLFSSNYQAHTERPLLWQEIATQLSLFGDSRSELMGDFSTLEFHDERVSKLLERSELFTRNFVGIGMSPAVFVGSGGIITLILSLPLLTIILLIPRCPRSGETLPWIFGPGLEDVASNFKFLRLCLSIFISGVPACVGIVSIFYILKFHLTWIEFTIGVLSLPSSLVATLICAVFFFRLHLFRKDPTPAITDSSIII